MAYEEDELAEYFSELNVDALGESENEDDHHTIEELIKDNPTIADKYVVSKSQLGEGGYSFVKKGEQKTKHGYKLGKSEQKILFPL